ncbi:hypothetical protein PACTADRAFT_49453 [Pachysolen tannophilus NRRL Y-2460]|uniref:Protein BZZ1 n=1 Tax=Pachysolen tannophilus NRRL Y-2460 TaxID=669874 RepID=A0A1E4TW68_PACTA|nr:hypothetical protein PACTADRAFT_49453 [Pachysolen tannophilus NRRL Y-2460]
MSVEVISIGNELKDGYKPTNQWVKNGINWLSDIEAFYRARASIEKEYSSKLQSLCGEYFKKKAKSSINLSVGDEPVITPGSLECASLVAWTEILSQTETISKAHGKLSADFEKNVAGELLNLQQKYEGIRTKFEGFNNDLIKKRDGYYNELSKAKKEYDSLCQSVENQRVKLEKSSNTEKTQKKLKDKEIDMNIGKNNYLIKINIGNRLKDKYYYQDLPEVLDGLQDLNESRVTRLNQIWLAASSLEKKTLENCISYLNSADNVVNKNECTLDTNMFIKHNLNSQWNEPQDFYYIPSSIWHDDDKMITDTNELIDLKKQLNNSISLYENLKTKCEEEKNTLGEISINKKNIKSSKKMLSKEEIFNYDDLLLKYLYQLGIFTNDDTRKVIAEVEIETIQNAAGDKVMNLDIPVETKKKSRLGFLKIGGSSHHHHHHNYTTESTNNGGGGEGGDSVGSLTRSSTISNHTTSTKHTAGTSSRIFGAFRNRAQSVSSTVTNNSLSARPQGKALYAYDAQGNDEVSVQLGETVTILESDDGSGWTMVQTPSNEQGLVPTSYLEIQSQNTKKVGPKVAPKKGAKKIKYCEALYDYQAQGNDELTLSVGDKISIITEDDGSGWTEGEIDGDTGLFPTGYVKFL